MHCYLDITMPYINGTVVSLIVVWASGSVPSRFQLQATRGYFILTDWCVHVIITCLAVKMLWSYDYHIQLVSLF